MNVPRVISLGQIIVDLTMSVDAVPRPGEDVFADAVKAQVGASYNMLHAVRCMGINACHGGVIGSGPWSDLIISALERDDIAHLGRHIDNEDCGFCVALTDATGERTFISVRGAEAHAPTDAFDGIDPAANDVLYFSGYTLAHPTAQALAAMLRRTMNHQFYAVFDVSPMVDTADDRLLRLIAKYKPIWTCNERESGLIARRFDVTPPMEGESDAVIASRCQQLSARLQAPLIIRAGAAGAWVCDADGNCEHCSGLAVTPVDTNGAGDCHTGVVCAGLASGLTLRDAVRRGNVAAALAVTRYGPATCPSRDEVDRLLPDLH